MFQMMMDNYFKEEIAKGEVIIYMDDILIPTKGTLSQHQCDVAKVLQKLKKHNLYLKPEKCLFHKKEVGFLGIIVGKGKIKMDPIKVKGLTDWPTPTKLKELRSFLGFGNYYKDFIAKYSLKARPLHDFTKKDHKWQWSKKEDDTFKLLKKEFMAYPTLRNHDPNK